MKKFELIIKQEGPLNYIHTLLDGEEIFDFIFRDDNDILTIQYYDNNNRQHYELHKFRIKRGEYMVYSFIQDLKYIMNDIVKKFKYKNYSNYPDSIILNWLEVMNKLDQISSVRDDTLPESELFKNIFSDFLYGKVKKKVNFTYLFLEKDYITFNSLKMNKLFFFRTKTRTNYQMYFDNLYFEFENKIDVENLVKSFDKKDSSYLNHLQKLIFKSKISDSRDKFINELLSEL